MRVGDFAARAEQVAVGEGGVDLAALAAHLMDTRIERAAGAQRRFHRQAARHGRGGEQVFRVEQAAQRKGGGDLGAVQQRQALFRRQRQRFQTGLGQRFGRRQPLALMARLAFAQQHQAHVRQRRQVAGGANRALQRDMRINFGVDQRDQRLDDFQTNAGEAARQAVDFQHHDQAHQIVVGGLAHAGGV
ncbi:Uncharacterised protein [Acinetobacter baumannii]|nr:Uncharacterised protein [Acinetobacter baumannii]